MICECSKAGVCAITWGCIAKKRVTTISSAPQSMWQKTDCRKPIHGSLPLTKTSGQNSPGAELSCSNDIDRDESRSRRLPNVNSPRLLKKTRVREGSSTVNRGTASEGEPILTTRSAADILQY